MSVHPVGSAVGTEHNRRHAIAQAVASAVCLFALTASSVFAEDPGTAAVNLLPAKGQHRGIVLKSQTVDAVISEDQGKVWADTKVWLRLHNPASKPITVSVTLPGPQLAPAPLPAGLDVHVGKTPLKLAFSGDTDEGQVAVASAAIGVPARRSVDVSLVYRQTLPESQGVFTYTYQLAGAGQWAGTPESLRVTVELKPPIVMRSLLDAATPAHHSNGQTLTWDWEAKWDASEVNIGLVFMSPSWFAEFETAKAAAVGQAAGADQHLLLSEHFAGCLLCLPQRMMRSLPSSPATIPPPSQSCRQPLTARPQPQ